MSMGTFDAEEFERRERMISSVETESDDRRTNSRGRIEFTDDESVDDLLARLKDVRDARD